jgi:hypothetical protein
MALTRVACNKEGDGHGSKRDDNKGGGQATATRVIATEGKQQTTSNRINKGRQWLATER